MIGCATMERHVVAASLKSPLERLAGKAPYEPQHIAVDAHYRGEIDPLCRFLYVDITHTSYLSDEVWHAIRYQMQKSAHALLYALNFRLDPGVPVYPGYQELALYPLRMIVQGTPTYAWFEPDEDGQVTACTYSVRPVITHGM